MTERECRSLSGRETPPGTVASIQTRPCRPGDSVLVAGASAGEPEGRKCDVSAVPVSFSSVRPSLASWTETPVRLAGSGLSLTSVSS
ncbi:hypothetical protein GCM10017687_04720 [Streptomyces echinatus]